MRNVVKTHAAEISLSFTHVIGDLASVEKLIKLKYENKLLSKETLLLS